MTDTYACPDCGREHDEPADASFVLAVLCLDCETAAFVDGRISVRLQHPIVRAAA